LLVVVTVVPIVRCSNNSNYCSCSNSSTIVICNDSSNYC